MSNRFIPLIENRKIRNVEELKAVYRVLAKNTHPDATGSSDKARLFVEITREYEEALTYVESRAANAPASSEPKRFDKQALYLELQGLLARGFPFVPKSDAAKEIYLRSREKFLEQVTLWNRNYRSLFEEFEMMLIQMYDNPRKKEDIETVFQILYDGFYFQYTGVGYYKNRAHMNYAKLCHERKYNHRLPVPRLLNLLLLDLENGPILTEEGNNRE